MYARVCYDLYGELCTYLVSGKYQSTADLKFQFHYFNFNQTRAKAVVLNNLFFNGPFTASFSLFRLFNTVDSKQMLIKSLPMPGFESRISGVDGDRSTTEPQPLPTKVVVN